MHKEVASDAGRQHSNIVKESYEFHSQAKVLLTRK